MLRSDANDYDVAVLGGGPAGSALATFLARRGRRCVIVERTKFPRYHVGESLVPETYGPLERLGILPKLRGSDFPIKRSVRFVSRCGKHSTPFYFSETIAGEKSRTWQIDRAEFDTVCLENARESGVHVREETSVREVLFDAARATGVLVAPTGGAPYEIRARVVVDASGRGTLIGGQLGLREPVPGLRKASLWSYFRGGRRMTGIDAGETTIFRTEAGGWFWHIPLPDNIVSVGIVAPPEYLFRAETRFRSVFAEEIERCPALASRLENADRVADVYGLRELAYRSRRAVGHGWLMVGDAMGFLDPIYSSGLFLALRSAELATDPVNDALANDDVSDERLGTHLDQLRRGIAVIHHLIHAFYSPGFSFREFVTRFPEHKAALIDCLVGDVVDNDLREFSQALGSMVRPPVV